MQQAAAPDGEDASTELPSVFFCTICERPYPSVGVARGHVTSTGGDHEGHTGDDPEVVVDAAGTPVGPPEQPGFHRAEHRTEARREALLGYIEDRGGSPHVIDHGEQADRFGVSSDTITQDLRHLRGTGEIDGPEPTERTPGGEPIWRCGFCAEPHESVRAVKTHVSKKSDPEHRDRSGSDRDAIQ